MGGMAAKRYYFLRALPFFLGFGIAISTSAADLMLQKVPPLTVEQAPNYPQNLARFDLGAQIESDVAADASSSVPFLSGDPASVYALRTGTTRLLIALAQIENIDSVAFLNSEAKGTVTIAMSSAKLSPESPQWHDARQEELSSGLISARIGPAEAKYVRLTFNVRSPGRIGSLGIYSAAAVSDFTMPRARKIAAGSSADAMAKASYNLADLHAKARTIFVSSGDDLKLSYNMIDSQAGTAYGFAANDAAPTAIIDLGRSVSVNRISTFSTPSSATVTFYLLGALPGNNTENPGSSLRIDPQTLAAFRTVGTGNDDGSGRVAVDFEETTARYVMLVWRPPTRNANFSVAEVAVFGPASNARLLASNTIGNNPSDTSDGKTVRDSKDAKDSARISARRFRGKDPRKSRLPAKVRRLNCLDLHHLSLSQELCQQARNGLWTRTLLCEPQLRRRTAPSSRD